MQSERKKQIYLHFFRVVKEGGTCAAGLKRKTFGWRVTIIKLLQS